MTMDERKPLDWEDPNADPLADFRRFWDDYSHLWRTQQHEPPPEPHTASLLLCRICHDDGRISLVPQDCTRQRHDKGETLVCPEGHVVFYYADYGAMDIGIIPGASD